MTTIITEKGQITIPKKLREKFHLMPGDTLEFDENAPLLTARKHIDIKKMKLVLGCCKNVLKEYTGKEWLEETRGPVKLPSNK